MFDRNAVVDFRMTMIRRRFEKIHRTVLVLSGKGGVGKSMVAATLASLMVDNNRSAGLLDGDLYGPSSPVILDVHSLPKEGKHGLIPPDSNGVKVMSVDLFAAGRAIPISGNASRQMIKEMLALTDWGRLDYLVVDTPPSSGDILIALIATMPRDATSVVVTTGDALSLSVTRRTVQLVVSSRIPTLGVLENTPYPIDAQERRAKRAEGRELAEEYGVRFLGKLPYDPAAAQAANSGNVRALLKTRFAASLSSSMKAGGLF